MRKIVITYIILITFCAAGLKASDRFSFNGYYKNFFVVYDVSDYSEMDLLSNKAIAMLSNRLRLNSRMILNDNISFNLSYGFVPRVQDKHLPLLQSGYSNTGERSYRIKDFDQKLYPKESFAPRIFVIYHNLDRAFFSVSVNSLDIYLGRQAIAWGSAKTVNPTDVIAPYSFDELDSEERIGVDAVRLRVPIGLMGEFDAGFLAGSDFEIDKSAFYLRSKFYAAQTDFSFLLLGFKENLLLGFDITRAIGGAGFWLEAAYVKPRALAAGGSSNETGYFRSTIGLDYSLGDRTYSFIEYHYNEPGKNKAGDYPSNLNSSAYSDGSVYLMGKHYLIPGISYQLTPLMIFAGQMWWNLSDNSFLITPYIEYNVAENIYLSGGGYIGIGKGPLLSKQGALNFTIPKSEFGSYTNSLFLSFRFYF